jgi:hypothetical protein
VDFKLKNAIFPVSILDYIFMFLYKANIFTDDGCPCGQNAEDPNHRVLGGCQLDLQP